MDPVRFVQKSDCLNEDDAFQVQGLQSSLLSYGNKVGKANFILNGGMLQPGCPVFNFVCNRYHAAALFVDTVSGEKKIFGINKTNKKECLFGIHNDKKEYGVFNIQYRRSASKPQKFSFSSIKTSSLVKSMESWIK